MAELIASINSWPQAFAVAIIAMSFAAGVWGVFWGFVKMSGG